VKKIVRFLLVALVLVLLLVGGFLILPGLVYKVPFFQQWVRSQINEQSGGQFTFDRIRGDAREATLGGAFLDMNESGSNIIQGSFVDLQAGFEWVPLLGLKLDLTELKATGGELILELQGGEPKQVRFPCNAETFRMVQGSLTVRNLQGYHLNLEECELSVEATENGKRGTVAAPRGMIGAIQLREITASFSFSPEGLMVTDFSARLFDHSDLKLTGQLALQEPGMPMKDVALTVQTEKLASLLQDIGYSQAFDGSVDLNGTVSGRFRPEIKEVTGSGTVRLRQITARVGIPRYPGFEGSGILKELREIKNLDGEAQYVLQGDHIKVQSMTLSNPSLTLEARPVIGFDKTLAGQNVLLVQPELAAGIPSVAQDVFEKDPEGRTRIPFTFVGTTNQPRVQTESVVAKALLNPATPVKSVGGFLGGLFGGGNKKEDAPEKDPPAGE